MAITFQDRVSTYPNRYKLKKSDGTSEYVTLERADVPTVAGTPLNADTFNNAFAPSGYGLGSAQLFSAAEINNIVRPGFYYTNEYMVVAGYDSTLWWMEVFAYGDGANYVTQRISTFWSGQGFVAERHKVGGAWKEWAWVNPPMRVGVEYRTTEYYATGANVVKPVYTVNLDLGKFTSGGIIVTPEGLTATAILRYSGVCNRFAIPAIWNNDLTNQYSIVATVYITDLTTKQVKISVGGGSNNVGNTVYMRIWYTKD